MRINDQAAPPADILDLAAATDGVTVNLSWTAVANADQYLVYRSYLAGGTYEMRGITSLTTYADYNQINGQRVYYKVVAVNNTTGLTSTSNEVTALPAYTIDWANLQWPQYSDMLLVLLNREHLWSGLHYWCHIRTRSHTRTSGTGGFRTKRIDPRENAEWIGLSAIILQEGNNDQFAGNLMPETIEKLIMSTATPPTALFPGLRL